MGAKFSSGVGAGVRSTGTTTENEPVIKSDGTGDVMEWQSSGGGSSAKFTESSAGEIELEVGKVGAGTAPSYSLDVNESSSNQIARFLGANSGSLYFRNDASNVFRIYTGASGSLGFSGGNTFDSNHLTISSTGLATFSNGISNERGIYGGTLSVADDAVGEITPPRQATFMTLSYNATSDYPSHWGGLLYMDVGLSIVSNVVAGPSSALVGVNSDVTGTTGSDGKTTVGGTLATGSGQIGKIRIENRHGTSVTYNYNFFG